MLSVDNLSTYFHTTAGVARAVDGVSFTVDRGEALAVVGESGSGKSVTGLSIMRLVRPPGAIAGGSVRLDDVELTAMPEAEMRRIRGAGMAMIFQDPMTSLNPYISVGEQLAEMTRLHLGHSRREAIEHAEAMLQAVGIPAATERARGYPHELSGGMRQRVVIAMALSCSPKFLIADEPTTALDATIQAQILQLIRDRALNAGTGVILISHDLALVAGFADKVLVMYAGRTFEHTTADRIFAVPANPYTKSLLQSMPGDKVDRTQPLYQIPGLPPDVADLPPGCPFAPRCYRAEDVCRQQAPPYTEVAPGHFSLCHFADEVYAGSAKETGP